MEGIPRIRRLKSSVVRGGRFVGVTLRTFVCGRFVLHKKLTERNMFNSVTCIVLNLEHIH